MVTDMFAQSSIVRQLRQNLSNVMRVEEYEIVDQPQAAIAFRGEVLGDPEEAFEHIRERFANRGYTAMLRDWRNGRHEVLAVRGVQEGEAPSPWLNLVLFAATVFSVLYIGAGYALQDAEVALDMTGIEGLLLPLRYLHWGIPFAATLMGILLAHELSHYFVARRYGSPVSLPYFIPMPNILGTMGAVISQQAPMRDRKALFDIGVAGPIGGLVVAIPLLVLGLSLSSVGPPPPDVEVALQEGNSLLYAGLKYLVFGEWLPNANMDVWLHPVAFAAWAGLLVTMINLIPVGQLDGGHISYALLGRKAWGFGYACIAAMMAWGTWLSFNDNQAGGFWLLWSILNLLMNRKHPPPLNDVTRLETRRIALGLVMLVVFILTFMPEPLRQITF
jgi:membrane-associated protease RseP (regulator of RpoE activity)